MPVNISCPACQNQGELPDDVPADATLSCRRCKTKFSPHPQPIAPAASSTDTGAMGVWVGDDTVVDSLPTLTRPPAAAAAVAEPPTVRRPELQPVSPVAPSPLAAAITPENAAAHLGWLREETERFEAHVKNQLAVLRKMRDQIASYESTARSEAVLRDQAAARDRAILDARGRELEAREAELTARLNRQAEELSAELDRQVAAERENLARRAEALARAERSLELRLKEVEELEEGVRRELDETAKRLTVTPAPQRLHTTRGSD